MSSQTAWQARFSRAWNSATPSREVAARAGAQAGSIIRLSAAQLRVLVALEAYRDVRRAGRPGPTALALVAKVRCETGTRALAALKAYGLLPEGMQ